MGNRRGRKQERGQFGTISSAIGVGGIPIVIVVVTAVVITTCFFVPDSRHCHERRAIVSHGRRIGFLFAPSQTTRMIRRATTSRMMIVRESLVLAATLLASPAVAPPADAIAAGRPRDRFAIRIHVGIRFCSRRGNRIGTAGATHAVDAFAVSDISAAAAAVDSR